VERPLRLGKFMIRTFQNLMMKKSL